METNLKVGDRVKFKDEKNISNNFSSSIPDNLVIHGTCHVDEGKDYKARVIAITDYYIVVNWIPSNGEEMQLGFKPDFLIRLGKSGKVTHIITYDKKGCGDPHILCYNEGDMKDSVKRLMLDNNIVEESVTIYDIENTRRKPTIQVRF